MSLAAFGVRKPVVANLVMFALVGAGLIFGLELRKEFFPETRPNQVLISAPYPGASPDEVEEGLAIKIEDAIDDLDGIEEINTSVSEGGLSVAIEFREGVDIDDALFEVNREMEALQDLPEESERIVTSKLEPNLPTIVLSIFGDTDERTLKNAILEMRDELRELPGMGDITVSGIRRNEITVEVTPAALLEHNISISEVSQPIRAAMVELPGGAVQASTQNVAIRTIGTDENIDEIRDIVIKSTADGQTVRLKDIGTVSLGFEDVDVRERLNGKPSVSLTVFKVGKQDAVEMSDMVKAYRLGRLREPITKTFTERLQELMRRPGDNSPVSQRLEAYEKGLNNPDPIPGELEYTTDLARFIVGRLDLLSRNALYGGILVLLTLVVLLNFRVAFWTAVGLGISLLGTLAAMYFLGVTLNLLTMFGLIIVMGLLVDDAIVVAENITARHEQGDPADVAAVEGTNQVNWPVVATVLTTICAFFPLSLIEGQVGDLLGALPLVVAIALGVSLIEALFILPSHMAHSLHAIDKSKRNKRPSIFARFEQAIERIREHVIQAMLIPAYSKVLFAALRARYLSLAAALAAVVASVALVQGGRVQFTFLGSSDAETLNLELQMPIGTPAAQTDEVVRSLEQAVLKSGGADIQSVYALVGQISSTDGATVSTSASHQAQLILELVPVERRERSAEQIKSAMREEIGEIPGARSLRIQEVAGGPGGPALTYTVVGDNVESMAAAIDRMTAKLAEYEGITDIADDSDAGRRELQIQLRDGARELGFTTESIARQIRGFVFGLEAHTFAGNQEDVDVRVILPKDIRRSLATIERQYVFTPSGNPVPLSEVAIISETSSYASIQRLNRERAITATADVDSAVANPESISAEVLPELQAIVAEYPGLRLLERGRQQDTNESLGTLPIGMLAAVAMIYVILTWLFQSYVQPILVLSAVPFATIGMILGHLVLGFDMTILSLIGFIALAGVVVNDSLIFMNFYNAARERGLSVFDACLATGQARLRPILLTTITTALGLLPLMLETSFQARFLIPMAITIACGLMSATFIILLVLPALLLILEDIKRVLRFVWTGGEFQLKDPGYEHQPELLNKAIAQGDTIV